jgi:dTDP-4-amino-4,6-dideoxygalactose transaminase
MALTRVPLFATKSALEPLIPEVLERQRAVIESGRYILGPEVEAFEAEFAAYVGRRHCIGVASGTDAITIALRAMGLPEGDEVVVPAFGFFATPEAVVNAGGRPVFCDIDPATRSMTAATAEAAIGERTRALLPVHMFGNPTPMRELVELGQSRGIPVLEDAAQAAGARLATGMAGGFGAAAAFSFYPAKNLGAFGDAGALLTDDDEVAVRARRLRDHGSADKWVHTEVGLNSRLDELQAAALRVLLPHLDAWIAARRRVAALYRDEGLGEAVVLPSEAPGAASAYHLYVVLSERRDELRESLEAAGIEARAYYTTPLHRQPALASLNSEPGGGVTNTETKFPNAERVASQGLALPMGPAMDHHQVKAVVSAVRRALDA